MVVILVKLGILLSLDMVLLKKVVEICGFILGRIGIMLDKFVVIREYRDPKVFRCTGSPGTSRSSGIVTGKQIGRAHV